jgi:hypothetical protein
MSASARGSDGPRLNSSSFEAMEVSGAGGGAGSGAGGAVCHARAFTFRVSVRAVSARKLPKTDFLGA